MDTVLFFSYSLAYFGLFIWGTFLARDNHWLTSANVVLLVVAALFYDNGIVALGRYIGEGSLLEKLNYVRFWLHALFTPMLVVFAWSTLKKASIGWAQKSWVRYGTYLIVLMLMILEIVMQTWGLELEAKREHGVLSYESVENHGGPPLMVIFITAILLFTSLIIWWKQKWPWFFIGTLLMIGGSFLMSRVNSGAVMNGFELILITSLIATKHFQDSHPT